MTIAEKNTSINPRTCEERNLSRSLNLKHTPCFNEATEPIRDIFRPLSADCHLIVATNKTAMLRGYTLNPVTLADLPQFGLPGRTRRFLCESTSWGPTTACPSFQAH